MRTFILIIAITIAGIPHAFSAQLSAPAYNQASNNGFLKIANDKKPLRKPSKGMSMRKVKRLFGDPIRIMPATGKPPIERWVYEKYTVYFEGKYVIHAVRNRQFSPTRTN